MRILDGSGIWKIGRREVKIDGKSRAARLQSKIYF